MKTVVFFLATFLVSFNSFSQTRIEIRSLVKMGLPDKNKHSMFKCNGCYIILEDCATDGCARILKEYYPPEIIEKKSVVPEGYELYFLFDEKKRYGFINIIKKEKVKNTFAFMEKTPLNIYYSPKY
ncbi:MAG: hypothetical protein WC011_02395 [Candidatus Paceibacterota bacterium]